MFLVKKENDNKMFSLLLRGLAVAANIFTGVGLTAFANWLTPEQDTSGQPTAMTWVKFVLVVILPVILLFWVVWKVLSNTVFKRRSYRRRRRTAVARRTARRSTTRRRSPSGKRGRLKKGSPEARAYMAKLRRKRKKCYENS